MQTEIIYTTVIWSLLGAVDRGGKSLDFDEALDNCAIGRTLDWLEEDHGHSFGLTVDERAMVHETMQALAESVDARRKFGVEHEGYHLLIAYCVEGIQRAVLDRHS